MLIAGICGKTARSLKGDFIKTKFFRCVSYIRRP